MRSISGILVALCFVSSAHAQSQPTGCSYDDGLFECDYSTLSSSSLLPLQSSGFSPIPQRLRLTGLPASLNSAVFDTDFASLSASDFDTNYPASLEFVCEYGDPMTLASGFLTNMDHVEHLIFKNCDLGNIPANAFSGVGDIDLLEFENGTVGSPSDDMLDDINIRRNTSASPAFPRHRGAFVMRNTQVTGTFPAGLFAQQTNVYEVVLRNIGITSIDSGLFSANPPVRFLDLSYNALTELPSAILSDPASLGVVRLYGLDIECTCDKLWFLGHVKENYLTLDGDVVCLNSDAYWNGKLAWRFYYDTCAEIVTECSSGVALAGACLTPIDLAGYSIGFVAFVVGWVVLGITIHTRRQAGGAAGTKKPGASSRKKPTKSTKPKPKAKK